MSARQPFTALPALALAPLLCWAAAAPVAAGEQGWRGPLPVRDQFPLELVALDFTPREGSWLRAGEWGLEIGLVHANTFEITAGHDERVAAFEAGAFAPSYSFVMDGETTRTQVRVDFGVSRRVQVGIEVPILSHERGFLDSLIDSTHDSLSLPGNDREDRPQDQLEFDVLAGSGRFRLDESSTVLGDAVVSVKFGLHEGAGHAISLVAEAKAPTGDEAALAGSGSWDFGLSLLGSGIGDGGRHAWHWGLGFLSLGEPDRLPIDFDDKLSGFFGYEFIASPRWSVVAQAMVESSALPEKSGTPHGDPRAGLAVGFHAGGETWQVSAGVLENLTTNDNTIDLGLFFITSWRH